MRETLARRAPRCKHRRRFRSLRDLPDMGQRVRQRRRDAGGDGAYRLAIDTRAGLRHRQRPPPGMQSERAGASHPALADRRRMLRGRSQAGGDAPIRTPATTPRDQDPAPGRDASRRAPSTRVERRRPAQLPIHVAESRRAISPAASRTRRPRTRPILLSLRRPSTAPDRRPQPRKRSAPIPTSPTTISG